MANVLQSSPTITDILWEFARRNLWPGSQKQANALMSTFKSKTLAQFQAYMDTHYKTSAKPLAHTPTWVMNELRPEVGNKVAFFGVDPGIAKILLQSASEGWTPDKVQSHLESNAWWSSHNQTQKQWLIAGPADQNVLRAQAQQKLNDAYLNLYGERGAFDKNVIDQIASGAITTDQWIAQQRNSAIYKARYAGNAARVAAGLPILDETQYRDLEDQYKNESQQYGVAPSQQDLTNYFAHDMQPTEVGQRLDAYRTLAGPAGEFVRKQFAQNVGLSDLSTKDFYGLLTEQRPDLVAHYANQTGTPMGKIPSLYDFTTALKQAQNANTAEFNTGGTVSNAPVAQPEKVPQQMAEAF